MSVNDPSISMSSTFRIKDPCRESYASPRPSRLAHSLFPPERFTPPSPPPPRAHIVRRESTKHPRSQRSCARARARKAAAESAPTLAGAYGQEGVTGNTGGHPVSAAAGKTKRPSTQTKTKAPRISSSSSRSSRVSGARGGGGDTFVKGERALAGPASPAFSSSEPVPAGTTADVAAAAAAAAAMSGDKPEGDGTSQVFTAGVDGIRPDTVTGEMARESPRTRKRLDDAKELDRELAAAGESAAGSGGGGGG